MMAQSRRFNGNLRIEVTIHDNDIITVEDERNNESYGYDINNTSASVIKDKFDNMVDKEVSKEKNNMHEFIDSGSA